MNDIRIFPLGERAVTIDFGKTIFVELNEKVRRLSAYFTEKPFEGLIECVPAYTSLTLFYDVSIVRKSNPGFSTAFSAVESYVKRALAKAEKTSALQSRLIEIPVCFEQEFAPDLETIAMEKSLTQEGVIEIFTSVHYRVFMLGFLPGFPYMGETDERIAVSRRATPRLSVKAGSVGLAGRQTGIYSITSPGGWQVIGRTPLKIFDPLAEEIALLRAGDQVKFYAIDGKEFTRLMVED